MINEEATRQTGLNGSVEGQENSRKRKLSSPPRLSPAQAAKDPRFWSELINRLYAQYRDHTVAAIKSEESKYDNLRGQLLEADAIEKRQHPVLGNASTANESGDVATKATPGFKESPLDSQTSVILESNLKGVANRLDEQGRPAGSTPQPAIQPRPSKDRHANDASDRLPQNGDTSSMMQMSQPSAHRGQTATPGFDKLMPSQSNPRVAQPPSPAATAHQAGMPPPNASPLRPVMNVQGAPAPSIQPGVPYSPNIPAYPPYPSPQGYAQWPQGHPQPQPPSLRASPYVQTPPLQQDFSGRTPIMARAPQPPINHPQYPSYPYHPNHFNGMQPFTPQQQGVIGPGGPFPWPHHLAPTVSTPGPHPSGSFNSRLSSSAGGRSPWKSTPSTTKSEIPRPPSREVSPIPERESLLAGTPATVSKTSRGDHKDQQSMRKPERPNRRPRVGSVSPSGAADRSRSESILSHVSEARTESQHLRRQIKHETPSTPLPFVPSDSVETDQTRSSVRRTRGNTLQGASQPRLSGKRKRGESAELDKASETPRPSAPGPSRPIVDQDKVYATRNFARICGPIMNDVTAHKHAGLFAKPLTERDAPGYRALIYRPSDLKSIKSMIHAGTKAVNAALEDSTSVSTPADGGTASPAVNTPTGNAAKNTAILLEKSADLVPPKAIVNSAQLEKELMRMFANAVMFNPMPTTERGFGPDVHLTSGFADADETAEDTDGGVATGLEFKGYSNEEDSGNIIRDTREMMETVEQAVRVWRDAEQGSINFGEEFAFLTPRPESTSGLRGGSVSETLGDDSLVEHDDGEVDPGTGTSRKRRRVTEVV